MGFLLHHERFARLTTPRRADTLIPLARRPASTWWAAIMLMRDLDGKPRCCAANCTRTRNGALLLGRRTPSRPTAGPLALVTVAESIVLLDYVAAELASVAGRRRPLQRWRAPASNGNLNSYRPPGTTA